jgi:DeoR family fructose operon transcriptional repressor
VGHFVILLPRADPATPEAIDEERRHSMMAETRRRRLLDLLQQKGGLSAVEAMRLLGASRMTVHRDFETLGAAGLLRKVHGGAVPVPGAQRASELARPFTERKPVNLAAKQRICQHLARIIVGARTLAFDASTTIYPLAHTLAPPSSDAQIFIVTNGIPLFQELLRRNAGFRVAMTGGEQHPRTESMVGPLAIKSVEGMRFDYAVVSAAGVATDDGIVYDSTSEGVALKQTLLARANKKVLAVDRSKFSLLAPYSLGALADFDIVVTEAGIMPSARRTRAKRANADV